MVSMASKPPLDLLFLGSGKACAGEGRPFSSFLLNGRYLFDCGPTLLQQLRRADVSPNDIEVVLISHFHADHFFGLPFLFLDGKYKGRTKDVLVVGPPGIEEEVGGLKLTAALVEHVPELECFAFGVDVGGRRLVYSGHSTLCPALLRLVDGADVIVLECSCEGVAVHLSPDGVEQVTRRAPTGAKVIVTHLDGDDDPLIRSLSKEAGLLVASHLPPFI